MARKWNRSFYQPALPLGEGRTLLTGSQKHLEISRRAASEGIVLLKNTGALPLNKSDNVAIFGLYQVTYVKGGGGSGEVTVEHITNIYEGMCEKEANGKVSIYKPLSEFYVEYSKTLEKAVYPGTIQYPECEISDELINDAADNAKTAIYVIGRTSGEGYDRNREKGDFYLSDVEEALLQKITNSFDKVIVVVNSGAQIDVARFEDDDKIDALVYAWQGGCEGGLATADVLCGDVNPSGRLVDTFARSFDDYPSSENFEDSLEYTKYYDDIFVGYRYFETIPGANNKVVYPFGYGLSYTTFELDNKTAKLEGDKITVSVSVKNTGDVAGRDVVQVYYGAPQGKLTKAKIELAGYKKTKLLAPGEVEEISISFDVESMASYDDAGVIQKSAYVMEAGAYRIYVGECVKCVEELEYKYTLDVDKVIEQLSPRCTPYRLEKRLKSDGTYETLETGAKRVFDYKEIAPIEAEAPKEIATLEDVYNGKVTLDSFIAQLLIQEKISLLRGTQVFNGVTEDNNIVAGPWKARGPFNNNPNLSVSNTCGIGNVPRLGVPPVMTADGPAGLRINPEVGVNTTAFPIATMLACTWDDELVYECGRAGGAEVKENNIGAWLTPALNIHRNPLCGRNFEYYSEDPLMAGKMASAMVRGIQSMGVAATPKHFACNNRENNRLYCDSVVSERALREIYIKGFEICVKEADPWAIMSSYNLLNGHNTSENYDLLTGILRDEWDYKGCVMSDWAGSGNHVLEVRAGNSIKMPWGHDSFVYDKYRLGEIKQGELDINVKRVLELILKIDC